ncbi:hypothetical protein FKM82_002023 [Ascaphus truei]
MCSDGLQYRALYEYKKGREEDISLLPGDLLTVSKVLLFTPDYKEGDELSPKGWLNGINDRTTEKGDFPGTYVQYVGPFRIVPLTPKPRARPVPPTPMTLNQQGGYMPCLLNERDLGDIVNHPLSTCPT